MKQSIMKHASLSTTHLLTLIAPEILKNAELIQWLKKVFEAEG